MNIIVDTQEKYPWMFDNLPGVNIIHRKLKTGDYSLEGYENILSIERKKSVNEIAGNISKKRFWREIERLSVIKHSFLIFEFNYADIYDYPNNTDLKPEIKNKIKVRGPYILREISRIQVQYGVDVMLCGHRFFAEQAAYTILKRVVENEPT
jgi:ERCC4-type nuclease